VRKVNPGEDVVLDLHVQATRHVKGDHGVHSKIMRSENLVCTPVDPDIFGIHLVLCFGYFVVDSNLDYSEKRSGYVGAQAHEQGLCKG